MDVDGARYRPSLHPSLQVAGYVDYMRDFVAVLADRPAAITGVAYLHNATDQGVGELRDMPATQEARLFTGQRRGEFVEYLRSVPVVPALQAARGASRTRGTAAARAVPGGR